MILAPELGVGVITSPLRSFPVPKVKFCIPSPETALQLKVYSVLLTLVMLIGLNVSIPVPDICTLGKSAIASLKSAVIVTTSFSFAAFTLLSAF